jgi:hypothetical protein
MAATMQAARTVFEYVCAIPLQLRTTHIYSQTLIVESFTSTSVLHSKVVR